MFLLTSISLFCLILYLIRFKTNNKRHFLNDGDRKRILNKKEKLKFIQFCNF